MEQLSYCRRRFPPAVIQRAIWLFLPFTLSYRDIEDLLAERGLEVSYETVRRWVLKFGPGIARKLRRYSPRPSDRCWGGRPPRHRCAKLRSLQISEPFGKVVEWDEPDVIPSGTPNFARALHVETALK